MRTLSITALPWAVLCLLLALTGCGVVENKRVDYQSGAAKMPSLEIPPDLTTPVAGERYAVSENGDEIVAVYSDYSKVGAAPQSGVANVLPEAKNVQMKRYGTERWLVVENRAENVWPLVKAFWKEQGFALTSEKPEAGLMETDWKENRATIPQGGLRAVIGKLFDKVYSSGEKDMFRTRLERAPGNITEIYISHRGMEEVLSADKTTSKWQPRPQNTELEATMLQMLMVKLIAEPGTANPASSVVATPIPEIPVAPKLQTEGGNKTILLSESFDASWRKVGLALEQLGIVIDDKNRVGGGYFIKATVEGGKIAEFLVEIKKADAGYTISVRTQDRGKVENAQHIVDLLYQQLIK
ncbi:MAG: outer membrane protein assembly factor BamC [Gallionellaceae bacterium]|nr:outer membrane protein assembly factor BamC [Gallionellaceae bacterium]